MTKLDLAGERDVVERVAGHGDHVGAEPLYELPEIGSAEHFGGIKGRGLDRSRCRHARFDHVAELFRVLAMGRHALIGAEADLHAGLVGLRERILDLAADARGLGTDDLGIVAVDPGLLRHELAGRDRRHVPGAVLFHQREDLVVHVGAVLDRRHAAFDRATDAFLAVRVRRDFVAVILRGLDHCLHLVDGELRRIPALRIAQHAARRGDLDDVRAFLVALAHGLPRIVDAVDDTVRRARRP